MNTLHISEVKQRPMSSCYSFAKTLSVFAFAVLGLSLSNGAFAQYSTLQKQTSAFNKACSTKTSITGWVLRVFGKCDTSTVGGAVTYIEHHHKVIKCTWSDFQGSWSTDPGVPGDLTKPIVVTQQVGDPQNPTIPQYATCSGWGDGTEAGVPPLPTIFSPGDHANAPFGWGFFWYKAEYRSTAAISCEDPGNAGIGNNCGTFLDAQNKKHNSGITLTGDAERVCTNTATGTELKYTFRCGPGSETRGYLTLVPTIDGQPQENPGTLVYGSFTNCSPLRIAAGECTMQYGGYPMKTVKQGKTFVEVVDIEKCKVVFPGDVQVTNALNSGQSQPIAERQVLEYTEVANGTTCDAATGLPTFVPALADVALPESYAQGTPTAAYGRFCQSDVDLFSDNLLEGGNIFGNEATSTLEGFDNVWRKCPIAEGLYHTGSQDVEKVSANVLISVQNQPNMNIACTGSDDQDNGTFKVWIPDQTGANLTLDNAEIKINPLSAAPKLYVVKNGVAVGTGIQPTHATPNSISPNGTLALELRYSRCPRVSDAIKAQYAPGTSPVPLLVKGETTGTSLLAVEFTGPFNLSINW